MRVLALLAGTAILSAGVALYLSASLGSGPFESLAFALRPMPFRVAYIALQAAGTGLGWLLEAPVGLGTVLIVIGVGPLVAMLRGRETHRRVARTRPTAEIRKPRAEGCG